MRTVATLAVFLSLVVGLALVQRLSAEGLALVIGIACGLAAGLPTYILLFFALRRRRPRAPVVGQEQAPPVIVVQGEPGASQPGGSWPEPLPGRVEHQRVRLVGGEDLVQNSSGAGGKSPAPEP